jgi:ribA/ribD-fused uncharacterized protein
MVKTDTHFFFYRHILGQWHIHPFTVDGITFNCPEQFMMYSKAILFKDEETAEKILHEEKPFNHQQLGRKVKNYSQYIWDHAKFNVIVAGNMARFREDEKGRQVLFDSDPLILVEASPTDLVYGVGLSETDPLILDEANWRGQNLLGKALMKVRTELMKEFNGLS